ncbi:sulfurtransferase [Paenibacillus psychroresistens]|uniref:Sulfurtransferase n=1 Tax=Paenibacillus psychroresistens TaxID=1778678 RepID=A0A6B8RSE8_9BACL|nr:sulfurtransferase [Paenibacillus psychroresistens]QGQ99361.1 sulfurtransferase [Paenibacillus psychroresistens]
MSTIVSSEWLAGHIIDHETKDVMAPSELIIVDCRFMLGQPNAGREAYTQGHIPGAVYLDLEQDLSGPIKEHGGRHPLPDLGAFTLMLGKIGIDDTAKVVAYDDQGGAMASRFWWMLHFLGHTHVYILDGGFSQWKAAGYPTDNLIQPIYTRPDPRERSFKPRVQSHLLVSVNDVKARLGNADTILIDSREERRYLGLEEPIDKVAGHIPGAINAFWKESLNDKGQWKTSDEQAERFKQLPKDKELIVYCGSGVTASPNFVALKEAGFDNVKLYAGSWSDWISYEENPVATGEE